MRVFQTLLNDFRIILVKQSFCRRHYQVELKVTRKNNPLKVMIRDAGASGRHSHVAHENEESIQKYVSYIKSKIANFRRSFTAASAHGNEEFSDSYQPYTIS